MRSLTRIIKEMFEAASSSTKPQIAWVSVTFVQDLLDTDRDGALRWLESNPNATHMEGDAWKVRWR